MERNERASDDASMQVVTAIADSKNVDPLELDFVLERYVDTDALDKLVEQAVARDTEVSVQFTVDDRLVTVEADGAGRRFDVTALSS